METKPTTQTAEPQKTININLGSGDVNDVPLAVRELVLELNKQKVSQQKIADMLNERGYRLIRGNLINQSVISKFLVLCFGIRSVPKDKVKRGKGKKPDLDKSREVFAGVINPDPKVAPVSVPVSTPAPVKQAETKKANTAFLTELTDLLTSNLNDETKERFAILLIKEKSGWFNPPS